MIAIYPGTFDPVTRSHIEIIRRASSIFDQLIVAVTSDTLKNTLFSTHERVDMMSEAIVDLSYNTKNISVVSFKGLLVNFAATNGVVGTPGLKFRTTNSVVTALKISSGWLVFGDLSA